jgi:5-methylcytosine-specific restriction endonuclease McrA
MATYDRAWQKVRDLVLKNAQVCYICGKPLDRNAPAHSSLSPSVDHIVSVRAARTMDPATREQLRLDPANLRPAHYGCNSARGPGRARPTHTSKPWR